MGTRSLFTLKNKRHMPRWLAWLLAGVMKLYAATIRVRITGCREVLDTLPEQPVAFLLWHNRVLSAVCLVPRSVLSRCTVMISASRDGEYISTIVRSFGLESVRGSSSRKGGQALLGLLHALKEGRSAVLTLDGPRGPRYTVHPGAVALGRIGAVPLVPIALNASHCWQMHSWDRMQIPWPFSKVEIVLGEPIHVAPRREASPPSEEEEQERIRDAMLSLIRDPEERRP
ncbi:MAG: lysophospholipid acyltransferase family protein [Oligosphaeraceae bacterium]